jgi:drug/metabolite transporter (DMT)-like permease
LINQEMIAILYGLASAVSWGTGDFSGGFAVKTSSVYGVLLIVYIIGFVLLSICALLLGRPVPDFYSLLLGAAAGISSFLGLAALYKSLADGKMGIVAPLTAVIAAVLPVFFGILLEGAPSRLQVMGFVIAFAAIWLLSAPEKFQRLKWRKLGLPAAAGLCFGLTFILIDQAAKQAVLWPLAAARCTGIAALIVLIAIFRSGSLPPKNKYPVACLAGIFDTAGTTLYALAAHTGRLDISAVLASMYPAATVMLAWLILKERLSRRQWSGVAAALIALALIAA